MRVHATRASGPGGQNVNKVATKVELRVELDAIVGLTAAELDRLRARCHGRLDEDGRLILVSQGTRSQTRNLDDVRDRLRDLVAQALVAPKRRIASKPSRASKARRVADKRQLSDKKRARKWSGE